MDMCTIENVDLNAELSNTDQKRCNNINDQEMNTYTKHKLLVTKEDEIQIPKKPISENLQSGFLIYYSEIQTSLVEELAGDVIAMAVEAGKRWKALDPKTQDKYKRAAWSPGSPEQMQGNTCRSTSPIHLKKAERKVERPQRKPRKISIRSNRGRSQCTASNRSRNVTSRNVSNRNRSRSGTGRTITRSCTSSNRSRSCTGGIITRSGTSSTRARICTGSNRSRNSTGRNIARSGTGSNRSRSGAGRNRGTNRVNSTSRNRSSVTSSNRSRSTANRNRRVPLRNVRRNTTTNRCRTLNKRTTVRRKQSIQRVKTAVQRKCLVKTATPVDIRRAKKYSPSDRYSAKNNKPITKSLVKLVSNSQSNTLRKAMQPQRTQKKSIRRVSTSRPASVPRASASKKTA